MKSVTARNHRNKLKVAMVTAYSKPWRKPKEIILFLL